MVALEINEVSSAEEMSGLAMGTPKTAEQALAVSTLPAKPGGCRDDATKALSRLPGEAVYQGGQ
jgi:hypothetical protein